MKSNLKYLKFFWDCGDVLPFTSEFWCIFEKKLLNKSYLGLSCGHFGTFKLKIGQFLRPWRPPEGKFFVNFWGKNPEFSGFLSFLLKKKHENLTFWPLNITWWWFFLLKYDWENCFGGFSSLYQNSNLNLTPAVWWGEFFFSPFLRFLRCFGSYLRILMHFRKKIAKYILFGIVLQSFWHLQIENRVIFEAVVASTRSCFFVIWTELIYHIPFFVYLCNVIMKKISLFCIRVYAQSEKWCIFKKCVPTARNCQTI